MRKILISVTLFNFLAAGISFLINVLLARIFSLEIYGRISLLLSFNAIFIILFQYGYNNTMVIFYNKQKNRDIDHVLLNFITKRYFRFLTFTLLLFVILIQILHLKYTFSTYEVLFLASSTLFTALYNFFNTYYQALGKWKKYNYLNVGSSILKGIFLIGGGTIVFFVLKKELTYEYFLKSYIFYAFSLLVVGIFVSKNLIGFKSDNNNDKNLFNRLIIALGITNIINVFTMRIDNVIIEYILGLDEVAIYSAANSLALVFPLITGSIMRVLMREMSLNSKFYLTKISEFQKTYFKYLIPIILSLIVISPYLIDFVFGTKYSNSIRVFQVLIITYVGSIFFTPLESFFYNENSKLIMKVKLIQLLTLLVFGIIFLNIFGLIGMAMTVLITRIIAWVYFYKLSIQYLKNNELDSNFE